MRLPWGRGDEWVCEGVNFRADCADWYAVNTQTPKPSGNVAVAETACNERRRSERHPYIIEAWLGSATDPQAREEVATLNLSRHGVQFQLTRPVKAGSFEVLEISMGSQKLVTRVQIKRCDPLEEGFWDVGAEFC